MESLSLLSNSAGIIPVALSIVDSMPVERDRHGRYWFDLDGSPGRVTLANTSDLAIESITFSDIVKETVVPGMLHPVSKEVRVLEGRLRLRLTCAPRWNPKWVEVNKGESLTIPARASHAGVYDAGSQSEVYFSPPHPAHEFTP